MYLSPFSPCRSLLALIAISHLLFASADAELRLPSVVGSNMVLQQEMKAPLWGWDTPGQEIEVTGSWGSLAQAQAGSDGKWTAFLQTPSHGGPFTVTIKGSERVVLQNVLIGEVWLCAGQSNMGWRLGAVFGGAEDGALANYPNFRIFRAERNHQPEPQDDCVAEWKVCDPVSAEACSAVTFYFARKIHEELGVPVGVVLQPYAGTPIEGWMPRDIQLGDERIRAIIDEMDAESARYDRGKAEEQLARAMKAYEDGTRRGKPRLRTPSNWGHQYPGNIYNGMIHPVLPFGIRGAIWYQGERNAKDVAQAAHYENQLPQLIDFYRSVWHEQSGKAVARDFPFYFVQLPSWHPLQTEPMEADAAWAVSRDAMRRVAMTVPNTGMAVSIDTGDEILLHPKDKKPIGLRLAYLALKGTYGKDFVDYGPLYRSMRIEGDSIVLEFDSAGSGLMAAWDGPLDGFAIAGQDRSFVWAKARIEGDKARVWAESVSNPKSVRYAWAMNPSGRNLLYNREGIPASPFRTDDWPLYDPHNYTPEEQYKPKTPDGYVAVDRERPEMTQ